MPRDDPPGRDADHAAVWRALSHLFLDTDPALSTDAVARELAASRYSVAELEAILLWEVYPVLWPNLAAPAGAWAGFDDAWLGRRIAAGPSWLARFRAAILGRLWVARAPEWRAIKARIAACRAQTARRPG